MCACVCTCVVLPISVYGRMSIYVYINVFVSECKGVFVSMYVYLCIDGQPCVCPDVGIQHGQLCV